MAIDTGVQETAQGSTTEGGGPEANLAFFVAGVEAGRVLKGGKVACGPQNAAITAPALGATQDAQARSTINQLRSALANFGITA